MTQPDLSQIEADLAKLPKVQASDVKGQSLAESVFDKLPYFGAGQVYGKPSKQYGGFANGNKMAVEAALVHALRQLEGAVQQPGTVDSMLTAGDTLTINYKLDLGASTVDIEVKLTAKEAMK